MNDSIIINRDILEKYWYQNNNTSRLLIHLLLKATTQSKSIKGISLGVGQYIYTNKSLSENIGITIGQLRASLNQLKESSEVSIVSTGKCSIVTVLNFDKYIKSK